MSQKSGFGQRIGRHRKVFLTDHSICPEIEGASTRVWGEESESETSEVSSESEQSEDESELDF